MGKKNSISFKALSLRSLFFPGRNQDLSLRCCMPGSLYTGPLSAGLAGSCPLCKGVSIHLLQPQSSCTQTLNIQAGCCSPSSLCSSLASSIGQDHLCLLLSALSSISEQHSVCVNHLNSLCSASQHFYF